MVVREDGGEIIAVGQPAHAWLSGQIARAWGNERFGRPAPWEEVCLATEQHDCGMARSDACPRLNPGTGRPFSFMDLPLDDHLAIWELAPRLASTQSRYAALLVSLHGSALYSTPRVAQRPPAERRRIEEFQERQRALQRRLVAALRADPATAPYSSDAAIGRNQRLVWSFDSLSLALLLDWAPFELDHVPLADGGETRLRLVAHGASGRHELRPWPFEVDRVSLRCEGRRLSGRFEDEEKMRAALREAAWETVSFELVPG